VKRILRENGRLLSPVVLIALLLMLGNAPLRAQTFVRGDANDDAVVDISDAITILLQLFAVQEPTTCPDRVDANDDGKVDLADPIRILGYLFAGAGRLPAPFPEAGEDPTPDPLCCDSRCNPDLTGLWSGTFVDRTDGEFVVFFEVEDTPEGAIIVTGLESWANEILDGEIFFWAGTGDRRLGFTYATSFDLVEGDFTLSSDATVMENGEYQTTSGTVGTFSMVRVSGLSGRPELASGAYAIVFLDRSTDFAWGGRLVRDPDGCVAEGSIALTSLLPCEGAVVAAEDPQDLARGVYTGVLVGERGLEIELLGLLAADTGFLAGLFSEKIGFSGYFLMAPIEEEPAP